MSAAGHLGISIGNTRSVAVHRNSPDETPDVVVLPTTLRFDDNGRAHLGEPAASAPFTRFVELVGEQEDLEPDADAYRAEDLMANAANCLVTMIADASGGVPVTTMTYPMRWSRERVALLRDALDHTGLTDVAIVPDAKAASAFAESAPASATSGSTTPGSTTPASTAAGSATSGRTTTVIDVGATGTDVSSFPGGGTVRTAAASGDVFTDALFDHVVTDRENIDLTDETVRAALAGVVAACEQAKHDLTDADTASIAVELPGHTRTATVERSEFAELIEPKVRAAATLLDGLGLADRGGVVVLTGASAAIDCVASVIAEHTTGPLLVEPLAAARGALLLAEIDDVDGNSEVTGAAPVVSRRDGTDVLDTDAIPIVRAEPSLAFSQALPAMTPVFGPSEFSGEPSAPRPVSAIDAEMESESAAASGPLPVAKKQRSERSRTIATIVAGATAGGVIVVAIAALAGMFSSTTEPTQPAVTDAGSPVVVSTPPPPTSVVEPPSVAAVPQFEVEQTYVPYVEPEPEIAPQPVAPAPPLPQVPIAPLPEVPIEPPVTTTTPVTTTPETTTPATTTTATTTATTTSPKPATP